MKKKILMIVVIVYVVASVLMIASMDKKVKRLEAEKLRLSTLIDYSDAPRIYNALTEEEEKTFRHNIRKLKWYFHLFDGIPNKNITMLVRTDMHLLYIGFTIINGNP